MPGRGDLEVVEGGAPRRLPRLQPERQGPDGGLRVLGPAAARRAGLDAAVLGRGPDRRGGGVHARDRAGAVRRDRRPGRRDRRRGRVARGAAGAEPPARGARARATRRGRRTTRSRPASRHGSSRRKARRSRPSTSRDAARVAGRRPRSPPSGRPRSPRATRTRACRPSGPARARRPPGRRKTTIPVIEIARAATKAEALEGLERWKARHPGVAALLEPADVLVDGMRGRSSLWYRVRVNLIHVPEADRPAQAELEVGLRPVGRLRMAGPRRPARARAAQEAEAEGRRAGLTSRAGRPRRPSRPTADAAT